MARSSTYTVQRGNHVLAKIAETGIKYRNVAREGVDDDQNPQLLARCQLVMDEVHRPDFVWTDGLCTVIAQLGLHPPLPCPVAGLHSQLPVNAIDFLDIVALALAVHTNMATQIAIAHARLTDFLDPLLNSSLNDVAGFAVKRRTVKANGPTGRSDRDRPIAGHPTNQFAQTTRLQIFRRMTSCNISLSNVRSATIFFNRLFSSSNCLSRFISVGNKPAYFFFDLK